jgi:hypothetical protein
VERSSAVSLQQNRALCSQQYTWSTDLAGVFLPIRIPSTEHVFGDFLLAVARVVAVLLGPNRHRNFPQHPGRFFLLAQPPPAGHHRRLPRVVGVSRAGQTRGLHINAEIDGLVQLQDGDVVVEAERVEGLVLFDVVHSADDDVREAVVGVAVVVCQHHGELPGGESAIRRFL